MYDRRRIPAAVTSAAVALLSLGLSASAATAATGAAPTAGTTSRYIVRLADPHADAGVGARVARALEAGGGSLVSLQAALGTAVVTADPATARQLAGTAGVRSVDPDYSAKAQSLGYAPSSQSGSMTNVTRLSGAQKAWKAGYTGSGVDVAVIDTGVAPVSALKDSAKVVAGPDLSFESQVANLRYLDTYGHGSHMASIIGGREVAKGSGTSYAEDTSNYYGMAPDARIISLKLGDHNGTVDVSQLIAAIDWVVQNKSSNGLNIKVLNLSFGTDSSQSYLSDPLAYAAQVAWDNGIFVVTSAGNDGEGASGLADPAYNPNLFAVGAVDTRGTDSMSDDKVAEFSQHPNSTRLKREPDLVAPGVGIVAAGVPGSYIYSTYPAARVGDGFLRGSGTSQAAAVVSGAAALVYQKWPNMSPGDVKELLTRTSTRLAGTSSSLQGRGELNVGAAISSLPQSSNLFSGMLGVATGIMNTGLLPATGAGSLEGARGSYHIAMDGIVLSGEKDIMNAGWANGLLSLITKQLRMWGTDGWFNGNQWIGGSFATDTTTVAGQTWGGRTWAGRTWSGRTWSGRTWSGRTWSSATWTGSSWTSAGWTENTDATSFAGRSWSSASWS